MPAGTCGWASGNAGGEGLSGEHGQVGQEQQVQDNWMRRRRRKSGLIRNFHDSPSFSPQLAVLPSPPIDFLSSPCQSPLSVRRCRRCCSVVVVVVVVASVVGCC